MKRQVYKETSMSIPYVRNRRYSKRYLNDTSWTLYLIFVHSNIGDVIDAFRISWERKMKKNIECDTIDSKINISHESKTIAWSAIVQRSHFLPLFSKRGAKTGEAKKHIIMYNGRKQPMKKNLREIIFQSDAKKRIWTTQIECKGQD